MAVSAEQRRKLHLVSSSKIFSRGTQNNMQSIKHMFKKNEVLFFCSSVYMDIQDSIIYEYNVMIPYIRF